MVWKTKQNTGVRFTTAYSDIEDAELLTKEKEELPVSSKVGQDRVPILIVVGVTADVAQTVRRIKNYKRQRDLHMCNNFIVGNRSSAVCPNG